MSDYLEACHTGSRFGFNDFNGLDLERFGGQVGSLRAFDGDGCDWDGGLRLTVLVIAACWLTGCATPDFKANGV